MNKSTLLPSKVKIRKCPSYFSGFFITLEWHLCVWYRWYKGQQTVPYR